MTLPKDPYILLSFVNTKLRDFYESLDELCAALCIDKESIVEPLKAAGYQYNAKSNQFCEGGQNETEV